MTARGFSRVLIPLFCLALLAAACGSDDSSESTSTDSTTATTAGSSGGSGGGSTSGASSADLEVWQADLAAVGCYGGAIDGELGPKTEQAIRSYQTAEGLTVDGVLGPETEADLAADAAAGTQICTSGGEGTHASEAAPADLEMWQQDLNIVGCYAGPIDGDLGPQTEAAIHAFQAAMGLTVDGKLGPQTEAALSQAAAAGETVCTNTGGGASGSGGSGTGSTTTLAASSYNKQFTIGSCSLDGGASSLSVTAQADNLTLVANATSGSGTLGVSGGTEEDGITLNGTISSVQIGSDNSFTASGTFSDPNFAGETFSLTGSC